MNLGFVCALNPNKWMQGPHRYCLRAGILYCTVSCFATDSITRIILSSTPSNNWTPWTTVLTSLMEYCTVALPTQAPGTADRWTDETIKRNFPHLFHRCPRHQFVARTPAVEKHRVLVIAWCACRSTDKSAGIVSSVSSKMSLIEERAKRIW